MRHFLNTRSMGLESMYLDVYKRQVDVLTQEPFDKDDRLLKLDNMIVTPHDAALNVETMNKIDVYKRQVSKYVSARICRMAL